MINIYEPDDYVSAFDSPMFVVTNTTDDFFEIDILDENEDSLGVKRLGGDYSYNVNVANYAKRGLDLAPLEGQSMGFAVPTKRITEISIDSEDGGSSAVKISAAREAMEQNVLLSQLPTKRNIALGERDELAFLVTAGYITAEIVMKDSNGIRYELSTMASTISSKGQVCFVLDMDEVASLVSLLTSNEISYYVGLELTITKGTKTLAVVEYDIIDADAKRVRLCWWNDSGALDYYSFYESGESKLSTDKQVIKTDAGYRTECTQVEYVRELYSKSVSEAEAQGVAKVVYSPAVWLCDGAQVSYVSVSTTQIEQDNNELPSVSFEISEIVGQQE